MPLYELTLRATYFGQQIINKWNYISSGTPAATSISFGLVAAAGFIESVGNWGDLDDGIFGRLRTLQSTQLTYTEVEARNVYDPVDFYVLPFITPIAGQDAGEPLSPVMSIGFRTNRTRTDIRRATKRFAGMTETQVGAGGVLVAGTAGAAAIMAGNMSATLDYADEGNSLEFAPCVVSKEKYAPEPGKTAYRYYPTFAEQMEHVMTSITWQAYPQVRTQVSRQYGRGA